jgi:hypothetical protein
LVHNKLTIQARQDALAATLKVVLWRSARHHPDAEIEERRVSWRNDYEAASWLENTLHFAANALEIIDKFQCADGYYGLKKISLER